jgi:methyl-accepting chemotaxis protein
MFALVLLFASMQSFYGLFELRRMNQQTNALEVKWLPAVTHASDMIVNLAKYRITQLQHVIADNEEAKRGFGKEAAEILEQFQESQAEFVKHISTADQIALHDTFKGLWAQYLELNKKLVVLSSASRTAEAQQFMNGEMRQVFEQASATLVTLVQINKFGAHQANEASDGVYKKALLGLLISGAVMMLLCSILAWRFASHLAQRVRCASAALQAMSDGALDQKLQANGRDEVEQLFDSLQRLNVTLRSIVSGVRQNAEAVATASTRMLEDSSNLSRRSEARAEAITQTAATMKQLGSTVRQNADGAKLANLLAVKTSQLASDSGTAVGEVVTTMKGIDASSKRIAAIIGVIDGIAFQTNILALNAAVEAARAGEQGRGFAVVATEVRSLAHRSAEAAREIKQLISSSVEQVGRGSALVDRAGTVMTEVVQSIGEVARMLGDAATTSVEQSQGVAEVGAAVVQMDDATQQDVALVADNTVAARELQTQALELVNAVAVFRLGDERALVAAA